MKVFAGKNSRRDAARRVSARSETGLDPFVQTKANVLENVLEKE
jgi:hypothetical protein